MGGGDKLRIKLSQLSTRLKLKLKLSLVTICEANVMESEASTSPSRARARILRNPDGHQILAFVENAKLDK